VVDDQSLLKFATWICDNKSERWPPSFHSNCYREYGDCIPVDAWNL